MTATRYYLGATATPSISPAFDSNWEQTGQAVRRKLYFKNTLSVLEPLTTSTAVTIPVTTTQDILIAQYVGEPLRAIRFDARNWSMVVGQCFETATSANAHLAFSLRLLSTDGSVSRGTLRSSFTTISEFSFGTPNTRIIAAAAVTPLTGEPGDRLCLEVGLRVSSPSSGAQTASMRTGFDAASDFALTTALTTDLNGWCEFEQDLFATDLRNYHGIRVEGDMDVTEKIR